MNLEQLASEVEAVSRIYASRHGIERSPEWLVLKLHEEVGELTQAFLMKTGQARVKGQSDSDLEASLEAELADVLAQALLIGHHFGIDMEQAVERKWLAWNPNRQRQRGESHGAVSAEEGGGW
ncbi:MazG nucleotide pyrophosphohydrolase domain-containing protein [Sinomonas terrae]|uniref:MazG nucleotide pyrophosphohydrolase domain-containing protein n=1 Tax=Sinomonas terrae TaxID=2908838 RepID=UPI0035566AC2